MQGIAQRKRWLRGALVVLVLSEVMGWKGNGRFCMDPTRAVVRASEHKPNETKRNENWSTLFLRRKFVSAVIVLCGIV